MRPALARLAFAASIAVALPTAAIASWSGNPAVNTPVNTDAGNQRLPAAIGDGAGGALIAWYDDRIDGFQGYLVVQHLLGSGDLDPAWQASGVSAGPATTPIGGFWVVPPAIASDGAGGAVTAYVTTRLNYWRPFANRVLASGYVHPLWPTDGAALCLDLYNQHQPSAQPDGGGGAIVAWEDFRGATDYDIYAAHALGTGAVDPPWPHPGVPVCTASNDQRGAWTAPDGSGGAVVFWNDYRSGGPGSSVYGHHVFSDGSVDPAWPANGRLVLPGGNNPAPLADGSGGAFVACKGQGGTVYVVHVRSDGTLDPAWPAFGRVVTFSSPSSHTIVSDGSGGSIVVWVQTGWATVRAHHVSASGVLDPQWPAGGREIVGSVVGADERAAAVSDGSGGAVIVWSDGRIANQKDIYVHRVLAGGGLDPAWPSGGRPVSTAPGHQSRPAVVSAAGGAIAIWEDYRSGTAWDLYADHIPVTGLVAVGPGVANPATGLNRVMPNPARSQATISWSLAQPAILRLVILDVAGRRVREIASGPFDAGDHFRPWDLTDDAGARVRPGLYFARLDAGSRSVARFVVER